VLSIAISLNVFKKVLNQPGDFSLKGGHRRLKLKNSVVKMTMRLYGGTANIVQNLQDANLVIRG
jgi:hypothetical protein